MTYYYNISENEPLLIFKIDQYEEGILIPRIFYEIFNSRTKEQLNLTICKKTKIKILYPSIIEEDEEFKHNMYNDYYNDICHSYTTKDGTDITLKDRKIEFNNKNLSLCESNCEYYGYNTSIKKVECNCDAKIKIPLISEVIINKDILMKIVDIKSIINLSVMKCYSTLFSLKGLKNNIGNYILLSIIFIAICCFIIYLIKGQKMLNNIIDKIVLSNTMKVENKDKNNIKGKILSNKSNKKKFKRKKRYKKNYINNIETIGEIKSRNISSKLEINNISNLDNKGNNHNLFRYIN